MYCSNCGQKNKPDDRYCLNCGMQFAGQPRKRRKWVLPVAIFSITLMIVSVLLITLPRGGTYIYGNTDGNLKNLGIAAEQGDWIYYVTASYEDDGDVGSLKRIRKDGTGRETIAEFDFVPFSLNVIDDWIYFCCHSFDSGIYKMCTDGSHLTKLTDKSGIYLSVINDWVYFLEYDGGDQPDGLYKMKTDGSELTKLFDGYPYSPCIAGDWIYYLEWIHSQDIRTPHLCKIKTDGSQRTILGEDVWVDANRGGWVIARDAIISGDWLYYISFENEDEEWLCKIRTDGSDKKIITTVGCAEWFNVFGEWIYYTDCDETDWYESSYYLYKIRTDGSGRTKILEEECQSINVVGDWIYYVSEDGFEFYRIRTDGTGKERVQ